MQLRIFMPKENILAPENKKLKHKDHIFFYFKIAFLVPKSKTL